MNSIKVSKLDCSHQSKAIETKTQIHFFHNDDFIQCIYFSELFSQHLKKFKVINRNKIIVNNLMKLIPFLFTQLYYS